MKKKKVKIAGKQVWLAYCYATELAFYDMTDTDINDFFKEFFSQNKEEDEEEKKKKESRKLKLILYAIFAAAFSYSESVEKDCEIDHKTLMFHAKPSEITEAFSCVIELRNEWYKLPSDDKPKKDEDGEKN
jgi:hypothetical protein